MSDFNKFLEIREAYAERIPEWLDEYQQTGDMRQDPYFMNWEFTPIEEAVWHDIRTLGLPFYPQIPVLNCFIDFGCPFLKIGIECDGKAWHDHDLDKARDARLAGAGWMIFRIEGHECKRVIEPWSEYVEDESPEEIERYFMTTSEGVMSAIKRRYFDEQADTHYQFLIDSTLFEHRSTPETYPVRLPIKKGDGPVRLSDSLAGYLEKIMERAKRDVA
jgi:very-short-patch-repair endonuclease